MLKISRISKLTKWDWSRQFKISIAILGLVIGQVASVYIPLSQANAATDTSPVTIQSFTASTTNVVVDNSGAQVDLSGTVEDNLSGFASMQVYYTSPTGKQVVEGHLVSADENTFATSVTFPRYSEPGVWVPTATFVDVATNILTLTPQELTNSGFSLAVTVQSTTPDVTPPSLTNFTILGSSSISVVADWSIVEMDIVLPDNLSGVAPSGEFANITVKYVSPSGKQSYSAPFEYTPTTDQYHASVLFPQHVEAGIWLAQLTAVDRAGNTRVYDANDLTTLGFASDITIASEEDTTPMSVVSMAFEPLQVDYYASAELTGGPFVTMTLTTSDDYAGVVSPTIRYRSTTSSQVVTAQGWSQYNDNSVDKSQFLVSMPMYAAEGDWLPEISTIDQAGNTKTYYQSDLLALGIDMKVTIKDNVTQPVDPGDTVTTDVSGSGATQETPVQVSVTSPVTGAVSITAVDTVSTSDDFAGYSLLPQQYSISAPEATPEDPLVLTFTIDSSQLAGVQPNDITIFRDGSSVGQCLNSNVADPDACVKTVSQNANGDVSITVNSSHASQWVFGTQQSSQPEFTFQGFRKPILAAPRLNKGDKAGSSITVKFSLGDDFGVNVLAGGSPSSQRINCSTLAPMDEATPTVAANGKELKINGNDRYRYDWKTLKDWSGTCRQFKLTFTTGETASAYFKFN